MSSTQAVNVGNNVKPSEQPCDDHESRAITRLRWPRQHSAALILVAFVCLLHAPSAFSQEPNTGKKTGTLKDGEKCEQLPCTCGNASATAVGCVCSVDDNLGPASGSFTCPAPTVPSSQFTSILVVAVIAVLLVGVFIYTRRRGPATPPTGPSGRA